MAVERAAGGTSLIDVLDRVLDKGIVIDAWVRVSLVGIDLQESARRSIDWLVAHSPVSQAVVLVVEGLSNEMLLVAEHGVSSRAIMDFGLSREDTKHPLIEVLAGPAPVLIDAVPSH